MAPESDPVFALRSAPQVRVAQLNQGCDDCRQHTIHEAFEVGPKANGCTHRRSGHIFVRVFYRSENLGDGERAGPRPTVDVTVCDRFTRRVFRFILHALWVHQTVPSLVRSLYYQRHD